MKKLLSLVLAVVMIFGTLAVPVYASAIDGGTITLEGAVDGVLEATKLANTVTVDFGAAMNDAGIENKISLAENGGSAVTIAAEVDGTDSKKVNISYGELKEDTEYVLTLEAGITAADGSTLDTAKAFTLETSESVYRLKEDFNYALGDIADLETTEFQGRKVLPSGLQVSQYAEIKEVNGYKYLKQKDYTINTGGEFRVCDPYLNCDANGDNIITEDFAFEMEFKGEDNERFWNGSLNISAYHNADESRPPKKDSFALITKEDNDFPEFFNNVNLTESNAEDRVIKMTAESKSAWENKMTLAKDANGFSQMKMVARMENGVFDLEMSSGENRKMAEFESFPSYNSFVLKTWGDGATLGKDLHSIGKVYIYKISPLKILKQGIYNNPADGKDYYNITVTDDIELFDEEGYLKEDYYETFIPRTFSIPIAEYEAVGVINTDIGKLRTDDGAWGKDKIQISTSDKLLIHPDTPTAQSIKYTDEFINVKFTQNVDYSSVRIGENVKLLKRVGGTYEDVTAAAKLSAMLNGDDTVKFGFEGIEENGVYKLVLYGKTADLAPISSSQTNEAGEPLFCIQENLEIAITADKYIYQELIDANTLAELVIGEDTFSNKYPGGLYIRSNGETTSADNPIDNLSVGVATADGDTLKYVALSNAAPTSSGSLEGDTYLGFEFTEDSQKNKSYILDVKMKAEESATSRSIRLSTNGGADMIHNMNGGINGLSTDKFGFSHIRYRVAKGEDGAWGVKIYDRLDSNRLVSAGDGAPKDVKGFFCQQYRGGSTSLLKVAEYKLYIDTSPTVAEASKLKGISRSSDEAVISFAVPVNKSTVTKENIVLERAADGKRVDFDIKEVTDTSVTLTLKEYLNVYTDYRLSLTGVASVLGHENPEDYGYVFKTGGNGITIGDIDEPVTFTLADDTKITELSESTTAIKGKVKLGGAGKKAKLYLVLYDEKGVIRDIGSSPVIDISSDTPALKSVSLTTAAVKPGYKARLFIWDKTDGITKAALFDFAEIEYPVGE